MSAILSTKNNRYCLVVGTSAGASNSAPWRSCLSEVGLAEVGLAEVGPVEVGTAEVQDSIGMARLPSVPVLPTGASPGMNEVDVFYIADVIFG